MVFHRKQDSLQHKKFPTINVFFEEEVLPSHPPAQLSFSCEQTGQRLFGDFLCFYNLSRERSWVHLSICQRLELASRKAGY